MCTHLLRWYWNGASCIMFVNSARLGLHAPFCRITSVEGCGHHSINQLPLFSLNVSLAFVPEEADSAGSFICSTGKWHTITHSCCIYHHLAYHVKEAADIMMDGGRLDQFCCGICKWHSLSLDRETCCNFSWLCHTAELWSLVLYSLCKWPLLFKGVLRDQELKRLCYGVWQWFRREPSCHPSQPQFSEGKSTAASGWGQVCYKHPK